MKDPRAIVPVSLAKRITQAVTYGLSGGFFSPQLPLQPQHQETAGRRFDYVAGYNISTQPRRDSGISFALLRTFAANYDLLRILIEKRKDQITNFDWSIVPKDEAVAAGEDPKKLEENAAAAQKFLNFPDGRQKWNTWLRSIIEDMLVLDAIAVWPVYQGKKLLRLETVDPATIKLVIDESGRQPEPPFPAYQQVLHGIPTADFLKDELLYFISNPASYRVYGLSKVEQIVVTVQIGLRRELSQLMFFTEGNVPAALAGVPETWNPTQIAQLQSAFDDILSGDLGARRKLHFIPGKIDVKELKSEDAILKGEFDEWIMRVMCYTFGVPPTPFTKQVNRATAFTAQEEARDEGLGPQLTFLKSLMDAIITQGLKLEGIEFKWSMEAENDPETQSSIDDKMLRNGSRSIDELRQRDGLDPLGIGPMIYLATGPVLVATLVENDGMPPPPPEPDAAMSSDPSGNKPTPNDKNASQNKAKSQGKGAASKQTGAKAKANGKETTSPDGSKSSDDKNIDKPLETAKKGGDTGSDRPFRKTKRFNYPSYIFRAPKAVAAQARLAKTIRGVGTPNNK